MTQGLVILDLSGTTLKAGHIAAAQALSELAGFGFGLASCRADIHLADAVAELCKASGAAFSVLISDRHDGVQAARAAEIPSIGAAYSSPPDEVAAATVVARTPAEVVTLVMRLRVMESVRWRLRTLDLDRPAVVGINGVDTSGKTRFTEALADYLLHMGGTAQTVHLDDFHNPSAVRRRGANPVLSYIDNAFDLARLEREILQPLRRDRCLCTELDVLDLGTDVYSTKRYYYAGPGTAVIVEGVLLYREPLDAYFDVRVFIHVPFQVVLDRAHLRDVPLYGHGVLESYRTKYIPVQSWYLENYRPAEHSDIVIDNSDYDRPRLVQEVSPNG